MRYLIWIPKSEVKDHSAMLESVGLGDHARGFDALPYAGPGESRGVMFGWLDHAQTRLTYEPEKQTWIPSLAEGDRPAGAYWVGIWNDSKPTEADLRRPESRKGAWIEAADGSRWQFPIEDTLERFPEIKDGKLTWVVDEQFAWFVNEINKRKAMLTKDATAPGRATVTFDLQDDFAFIVRLLQINYRIVPEVVVHLRLISLSLLKSITAGVLGFTVIED